MIDDDVEAILRREGEVRSKLEAERIDFSGRALFPHSLPDPADARIIVVARIRTHP